MLDLGEISIEEYEQAVESLKSKCSEEKWTEVCRMYRTRKVVLGEDKD